jgi:hypothetical protein
MLRRTLIGLVAVGALLVTGCADDDAEDPAPLTDVDGDQDRDQDQIHRSLASTLEGCELRDRDRLREQLQERLRERLDGAGYRYGAGTAFEILDEQVALDGDRATVQTRLRIQERDREQTEAELQWRLERADGTWQLTELPPCVEGGTTPSTLRDQDRDRDQDQDRDQGS